MLYAYSVITHLISFALLFCANSYLLKNLALHYGNDTSIEIFYISNAFHLLKLEIIESKSTYGLFHVNRYAQFFYPKRLPFNYNGLVLMLCFASQVSGV